MKIRKLIWNYRQKITGEGSAKNSHFIPIIKKSIPKDAITVIDVGCGRLEPENPPSEDILISCFSDPKFHVTGIDGFQKNIEWRKAHDPTGDFILSDVRDVDKLNKKFDVVVCNHVIEHFEKDESLELVKKLGLITNMVLIIGTPNGFVDTKYNVELHNNPLELHKCGWHPKEFQSMGYQTFEKKNAFIAIKKFQL